MLADSIVALATVPGRSALAVVRLSGPDALAIAGRVLASGSALPESRRVTLRGLVGAGGVPLDQALITVFRAPHSYTGEDLVEFSCHGGLLVPAQLLAALEAAGARAAARGEFTRRALLNGKLDLLQAEAVGDLIEATAPAQGRAALHQLEGGLSRRVAALREALLDLLALMAYDIDFPEEDDGPIPAADLRTRLQAVRATVKHLLATAPAGRRLHDGALVVLAGRPNAGKSSLFNALLGIERALVTELPGTTRDTIEAATEADGWPVRLADTAGLRESGERLEQMGIEVSRRYVNAADLLLLCVESGRPLGAEERVLLGERVALLVRTKSDLVPIPERESEEGLPVSTLTAEGLAQLRSAIVGRLFDGGGSYAELAPMLTSERHRVGLVRADAALAAAESELGGEAVLAAHQLREAVAALEELIGLVHPDEVLGRIFERFCVGK